MKKILAALKRAPKRSSALVAMVAAAIILPAALFAWGPGRPTYTMAHPADHVTFNSITDNPTHGNELNFVQIKDADAAGSTYGENVTLQPGKNYDVYVYYHNNAASNLNDAAHNYVGVAKDATMRVQMPASVAQGQQARVTAFVGASNAAPAQVWDEAYGTNNTQAAVALRYVPGSAVIHSNGAVDGQKLPDSLYTTGTPLGYDKLDGTLPGCTEYAGYVIFQIHVDQPNFTITKQVAKAGDTTYAKSVSVTPGSEVQYKIQYNNTGTTRQNDVTIRDQLPAGVTYVPGSTYISNSNTNSQWSAVSDDGLTKNGLNIGAYEPAGNAYVKFTAKVASNDSLAACGVNTLTNTAIAQTNNGNKSDTANVVVSKDCTPPPATPVFTCDMLSATKISETEYKFSGSATAKNGASIVSYTFKFGDGASQTVTNPSGVAHTYAKTGNYNAILSVTFKVNGVEKTITGSKCATTVCVTITPPAKPVYTCDSLTVNKIDRTTYAFTGKASAKDGATITNYTIAFGDGTSKTLASVSSLAHTYAKAGTYTATLTANVSVSGTTKAVTSTSCSVKVTVPELPPVTITVCDLTTKKVVTINESDFDSKKYSKNLDDCKAKPPVTIQVCELSTKKIVTINEADFDSSKYSKNLDDCATKPPVTIKVCNLATKQVVTINESDFDSKKYSKNLDDCKAKPPVTIQVCELASNKIVTINEAEFDSSKYSKNLDDCKAKPGSINVCELSSKTVVTITEDKFDETKYSKNLDDCKTTPPVEMCTVPGKENMPKDSAECAETPAELPHTGTSDGLLSFVGAGSLIAAMSYYVASRKNLG